MNPAQIFKKCNTYSRLTQMLPPPAENMEDLPTMPPGKLPYEAALWAPIEDDDSAPETTKITESPGTLRSQEAITDAPEPFTQRENISEISPYEEKTYSTLSSPYSVVDYVEIPKAPRVPKDFAITELPPSRHVNVVLDENGNFKFTNNKHLFHGNKLRVPKHELANAIRKAKEEFATK